MSEPFLGEIRIASFNFPPKGWAQCDGNLLPINQNQALFSILGTTYGGDGRVTFGLPNFQGRVPIHTGGGFNLGQLGGEETHTVIPAEMAAHTHPAIGSSNPPNVATPGGNFWSTAPLYGGPPASAAMAANTTGPLGGNQAHENRSPYLVLNFIIALQGIFPSQN